MKKPVLRNLLRKREIYHLLLVLITLGFLCFQDTGEAHAQQGLAAAYGFSEGTGATTADASGNGNTGTISGATWSTSGKFGKALSFDGANDSVTISDSSSLDLSTGMTLEAWIFPTALSGWRTVILKETSGGLAFGLYASDDASKPSAWINLGGFDQFVVGSSSLPLNSWSHVATTYDGTSLRLFVNGALVGSRSVTGSIVVSSGPLRVGGNAVWGEYFAGRIDEVRAYSRSLSSAEIQADMNTPIGGSQPSVSEKAILLVMASSNAFSQYYSEILLAEGLNSFSTQDINAVSSATLLNYDVVILGSISLTSSQVTMLTNWVDGGGNLIAMRPDKQLAGLLGLSDAGSTLSEGYLKVNTASGPGAGIVGQTMQFHGTADRYALLSGTSSLATLYSNPTTPTSNPAVTLRSVGSNGGQAAAFTFDLAKSVIYTRQGNPAWAGQERDGYSPIRSDDLFYPNWIDLNKIAIPQADEQQRLLANLIIQMSYDRKPVPRFWYFPDMFEAVVVMTGDDHGLDGTAGRFDQYIAYSSPGCSVEDWECVRGSSYLYPDPYGAMSNSQALAYSNMGFEVGMHVNTGCVDFTRSSLEGYFAAQLSSWKSMYPSLPSPRSHRAHCIVWSDYTSMAEVELSNGIRLDVNYYYWPPSWTADRPGFFTGSGMPMRFAKSDGSTIDVYQATTQMTDESGQSYPYTIDTLLDRALGPEGFYAAFVANIHTDTSGSELSDLIVQSAQARSVPVISARQLLTWLDARNSSSIKNLAWNGDILTFSVEANANARNLQAMVPITGGYSLTSVKYNGGSIGYGLKVIKGIQYAIFPGTTGTYEISFTGDDTAPAITSVLPPSGATEVSIDARITVTFSEAMDPGTISQANIQVRDSLNNSVSGAVTYDSTAFKAVFQPTSVLKSLQTYTATVVGGAAGVSDAAGNPLASNHSWSFITVDLGSQELFSIWNDSTVPSVLSATDPNSVELGLKFKSSADGYITGIRFYKGVANTGTHTGSLWTQSGALLGSVTFTNETVSGWQQQSLTSPVAISANTIYVVSYHTNAGGYSYSAEYFANSGFDNAPLRALSNSESGGNGVYRYGSSSGFPTETWNSTNYWVDIIFQGTLGSDTTPPTVISVLPSQGAGNISTDSTISVNFSEAMDPLTIEGNTFTLVDPSNAPVLATVTYNSATKTATLDPTGLLSPSTAYRATVVGGSDGVKDVAGNSLTADYIWSFTTASGGTPTTYSIWEDTAVPSIVAANDSGAVELGVKFRSSVSGSITGILFYKGSGNTGTHVGNLWDANGTRLATVTFTNETASGWQYQALATPVAISANTTYVVSYFAPVGRYSADVGYFASTGVDSSPLRAPSNSESGGNGVYRYGSSSAFPNQTWNSTNYWVDIEFKE